MRAVVVEELIGPDGAVLRDDVPEPEGAHPRADGQRLLVDVHAASVSFPDLLQSRGEYQIATPPPFVSGGEFAGVVVEAPAGSGFVAGDRVAGMSIWGALGERALALPTYTLKLPDTVDYAEGAALFLNSATAWFAIDRAGVRAGETVLVHGAAGGVGTAALEMLKAMGARSIAVVSSDEKERVARELGADAVVRSTGDWLADVRELTDGHGVEVVLDPVGGDRFTDSLRALDVAGRLVVIGFAGGGIPEVKVNRLLLRNLTVTGIGLDPMERRFPGTVARVRDAVVDLAARGVIRPRIGTRLPLERGADALRVLERRAAIGNVVVDVRT
ncbi:MAG TPA: NADPH:quinone oxidoreductase family protein [Baekduia sp.]|uniref:NADPH:quinone oxidoreductase family protein n=1 Tax=Baekduia sp. TaxID=2600305 RepID=UPI002D7725DA|nr:NADPH:quinone oxidoreductase family protein [Baekduia sp.]HET6507919.1 NADPH:quinone oxidoreductase family protein [Baekduia sp.]